MPKYIHELPGWPNLTWDSNPLIQPVSFLRLRQGRLIGRMENLGLHQREEAELQALTQDVIKSSEIEGESLPSDQVRSSIARRLGIDAGAVHPSDRRVEGVVEMTLEATRKFDQPLTRERLFRWHKCLFPEHDKGMKVGSWRDDAKGPMQVVSGPIGREHVHYEAPPANQLDAEMARFFEAVNNSGEVDPLLRAGLAHLWFVTIHPFDDGNGRIARAIADWALARSENSSRRYYSMSAQIRSERSDYYRILESTQKGELNITPWLQWFLKCLDRAIDGSEKQLDSVVRQDRFWKQHGRAVTNERQRKLLILLLDKTLEGKLTSSKWAKMTKCSQDTAGRDIQALIDAGILVKEDAGGRSTSYALKPGILESV
jgi:Fic family protein